MKIVVSVLLAFPITSLLPKTADAKIARVPQSEAGNLARREAKLKKLGIKPAKVALIMQRERKFEGDRLALGKTESECNRARSLIAKHETFLKRTLGAKMFAAYYMSDRHWADRRQVASAERQTNRQIVKVTPKTETTESNFYMSDDPVPQETLSPGGSHDEAVLPQAESHHPASDDSFQP